MTSFLEARRQQADFEGDVELPPPTLRGGSILA